MLVYVISIQKARLSLSLKTNHLVMLKAALTEPDPGDLKRPQSGVKNNG